MWYKYLMLVVISFFTFSLRADAALCDKEHISQLKELANQVEVSYEYNDYSDSGLEEFVVNSYTVSVNLISDELYLHAGYDDYYFSNYDKGIVKLNTNSGSLKMTVHSRRCASTKLRTINMTLPKFNTYSYRNECEELVDYNLDVCNPWYQGTVNDKIFYNVVNKYLNNDDNSANGFLSKTLKLLVNYYLYILGGIALIVIVVIGRIVHRKRSVLE